ncbi:MAG: VOC family protein [Myxococcota bacterium]
MTIGIVKVDHVGIRVRQRTRAIAFYEQLGFEVRADGGFERGHPIIMEDPSGVVINLLGPATTPEGPNVLMDVEAKHSGYTHMALRVSSLDDARAFLADHGIAITGQFSFGDLRALFIRDPDGNVIELDEYPGGQPTTRQADGYEEHP